MIRRLPILATALTALALVVTTTSASASPASATSAAQAMSDRPLSRLVDGIFDTSTERVTLDVQRFFGLAQDGIVGEHTRDVMRITSSATPTDRSWL